MKTDNLEKAEDRLPPRHEPLFKRYGIAHEPLFKRFVVPREWRRKDSGGGG